TGPAGTGIRRASSQDVTISRSRRSRAARASGGGPLPRKRGTTRSNPSTPATRSRPSSVTRRTQPSRECIDCSAGPPGAWLGTARAVGRDRHCRRASEGEPTGGGVIHPPGGEPYSRRGPVRGRGTGPCPVRDREDGEGGESAGTIKDKEIRKVSHEPAARARA